MPACRRTNSDIDKPIVNEAWESLGVRTLTAESSAKDYTLRNADGQPIIEGYDGKAYRPDPHQLRQAVGQLIASDGVEAAIRRFDEIKHGADLRLGDRGVFSTRYMEVVLSHVAKANLADDDVILFRELIRNKLQPEKTIGAQITNSNLNTVERTSKPMWEELDDLIDGKNIGRIDDATYNIEKKRIIAEIREVEGLWDNHLRGRNPDLPDNPNPLDLDAGVKITAKQQRDIQKTLGESAARDYESLRRFAGTRSNEIPVETYESYLKDRAKTFPDSADIKSQLEAIKNLESSTQATNLALKSAGVEGEMGWVVGRDGRVVPQFKGSLDIFEANAEKIYKAFQDSVDGQVTRRASMKSSHAQKLLLPDLDKIAEKQSASQQRRIRNQIDNAAYIIEQNEGVKAARKYKRQKIKELLPSETTASKVISIFRLAKLTRPGTGAVANVSVISERVGEKATAQISGSIADFVYDLRATGSKKVNARTGHLTNADRRGVREAYAKSVGKSENTKARKVLYDGYVKGKSVTWGYGDEANLAEFKNPILRYTKSIALANVSAADFGVRWNTTVDRMSDVLYARVRKSGLNKQQALDELNRQMADPGAHVLPEEWEYLDKVNAYSNFSQENFISKAREGIDRRLLDYKGPGKDIARFFLYENLPFVRAPTNVVTKSLERLTPLQLLVDLHRWHYGDLARIKAVNRDFALAEFARRSSWQFASVPLLIGGIYMAKNDMVSGAYPTDPAERAIWEKEGRKPWSVKVGGNWISAEFLNPAIMPIFGGQIVYQGAKGDPEALKNLLTFAPSMYLDYAQSVMEELPGLDTATVLLGAVKGSEQDQDRAIDKIVQNALNSTNAWIPNLIAGSAQGFDGWDRQINYDNWFAYTYTRAFSKIPGFRNTLPEKYEKLSGEPRERAAGPRGGVGGLYNDAIAFAFGSRVSRAKNGEDPVLTELRRMFDSGYKIAPRYARAEEYSTLDRQEVDDLNAEAAVQTFDLMEKAMLDDGYASATDEEKKDELNGLKNDSFKAVWSKHDQIREDYDPMKPPNKSKVQKAIEGGFPIPYFSDDWTPAQEQAFLQQEIDAGKYPAGSTDLIKKEQEIREFGVQQQFYDMGHRDFVKLFHSYGNKHNLATWFSRNTNSMAQITQIISIMAAYETELLANKARFSRTFTTKSGRVKSLGDIFSGLSATEESPNSPVWVDTRVGRRGGLRRLLSLR